MIAEQRIFFLKRPDGARQIADLIGFRAADVRLAARDIVQRREFPGRFVHHIHNVLRPLAQQHAFIRQAQSGAAPAEELLAQFLLQILHLLGQRRLGNVQRFRRPRHIARPGNFQKIAQYADLHKPLSFGFPGIV